VLNHRTLVRRGEVTSATIYTRAGSGGEDALSLSERSGQKALKRLRVDGREKAGREDKGHFGSETVLPPQEV